MNDSLLKTIAAEIGVDVSLGIDQPLSPKVMAELYKGEDSGGWVDGAKWFESWKAWARQHTELLPTAHNDGKYLIARLSQRFSVPPLELQLSQNNSGSGVKPAFTGVPFALIQAVPGAPNEVKRGYEARMVVDPCTMKSVTEWKLITKTQTYNAYMEYAGTEPLAKTLEQLLEKDDRMDLQFITTQDLCRGLTTCQDHQCLQQEQEQSQHEHEVLWDRETRPSLEYYGDFPLILQVGDTRRFHTAHFGLIPVVKSLFPQHDLAPRASRDEILVVVGQDFIEHKPYYKYIINSDSQDLIFDFDFLAHRQPSINYSPSDNGQVWLFVDGFCRDGAAWAVTYHKPGSWFNGVLLLNEANACLNEVPITLKAIWKTLMQIRDPQFCSLNAKKVFSRVILYVSKQDIAAAFFNDRAMIRRWQQNGWTKPNGNPVAYRGLWEDLLHAIDSLQSLLQIEISIRYQTTGGVEVGLECLKRLKNSIPTYINLRRPNIATQIMNVTPLKTRMEFKELVSKGVNYRGFQCDVLLPKKLQEIAKVLQKEGCTSCKDDHKAYSPPSLPLSAPTDPTTVTTNRVSQGRIDSCPLLSKIPYPISSETSVSRETIALHDILGPTNGMKPNQLEPFGHQLCLCSPDSEAMRAALSILCDTHVIMYGHNNWIAMSKAELVMSLADADEAGLTGGMHGSREWIDLIKSSPVAAVAYDEFQHKLKDKLRQAKKKRKGNKKKVNQEWEDLKKINSKKLDRCEKSQPQTMGGIPTIIPGQDKQRPWKGKEKEVSEQEHKSKDHSGSIMADWGIGGLGEEQEMIDDKWQQSVSCEHNIETHNNMDSQSEKKSRKEKENVIQMTALENLDTVNTVAEALKNRDTSTPKLGTGPSNAKENMDFVRDTSPVIKGGDDLLALKEQMDVAKNRTDDDVSSYTLEATSRISELHLDNTDCSVQENDSQEGGVRERNRSLMVQRGDACPIEAEKQPTQRSWADIGDDDDDEYFKTLLEEVGSWQKVSTRKERRKARQSAAGSCTKSLQERGEKSGKKFEFRELQEGQVIKTAVGSSPEMGMFSGWNKKQEEAKSLQEEQENKMDQKVTKLRETLLHLSDSAMASSPTTAPPPTTHEKHAPTTSGENNMTDVQHVAVPVSTYEAQAHRTSIETQSDNPNTNKVQQANPVELLPVGPKLLLPLPLPLVVHEEPSTGTCSGQRLDKGKRREIGSTILACGDGQRQLEAVEEATIVHAAETRVELRPKFGDAPQWVEVRSIIPIVEDDHLFPTNPTNG